MCGLFVVTLLSLGLHQVGGTSLRRPLSDEGPPQVRKGKHALKRCPLALLLNSFRIGTTTRPTILVQYNVETYHLGRGHPQRPIQV